MKEVSIMISAKRAISIAFEQDREAREKMIDGMKEQDAKYMLKMILRTFRYAPPSDAKEVGEDKK